VSRRPTDHQPAFDPIAERLVDIGRHLREARQQRGEDLYDVADYLRIKPSYLFALEEGDLKAMPGRTYALGFLRTYADHLGYDGAELVRQLKATAQPEGEATLQVRQPVAESRLPSMGIVVVALLLAGVAYGGWFAAQSGDDVLARVKALPGEIGQYAATMFEDEPAGPATAATTLPDEAPGEAPREANELPPALEALVARDDGSTATSGQVVATRPATGPAVDREAAAVSRLAPPAGSTDITAVVAGRDATAAAGTAAPTGDNGTSEDSLAALVLDAEAERTAALRRLNDERPDGGTVGELLAALQASPGEAAAPPAPATADAPVSSDTGRITLLAREAAWIQVQSPARDYLRSTTLEPGQRFDIPDRTDLALWTGNAGGLEVWVDGQNLGPLGANGAVMRDVTLTPEALRALR
jgi:cytoskeleton protein RodZ